MKEECTTGLIEWRGEAAVTVEELGPASRDKEARMRALIDAAVALFAEEGYGPVSTRRIAARAGCSETLLFRYFGGKKGLLRAISEGLIERSVSSLPEFNDVHECVRGYLLESFKAQRERAASLKVVIAALVHEPELAEEFKSLHDAYVEMLAGELRRFQAAGDIAADVDVQAVAAGLEQMGFAAGFLMQILYHSPQSELEAIADTFAAALSAGLRPQAAAPIPASLREQTLRRALETSQGLGRMITLLESWPAQAAEQPASGPQRPSAAPAKRRSAAAPASSRRRGP